jgi:rhodanese-related sulfurtransferase
MFIYGISLLTVILLFGVVAYIFIERMYPHSLRITAKEASELIQTHGAKIVDVRTKAEWDIGHFPGAIHIPVNVIKKEASKKLDYTDVIIVYCNTGTRARNAANTLKEMGYDNVKYIAETYHEI